MVERTAYGKLKSVIVPPDLIEIQTKSYNEFLQPDVAPSKRRHQGLQGIFKEIFPIISFDGRYNLEFIKYELDNPKYTALEALREGTTHSAPLRVTFRLSITKKDGQGGENIIEKTEEVYMGEIPMMTNDGGFVVNGAERVIVSQLHRSPGICSERTIHANGTPLYSVRIIPDRGSWIEIQFDTNEQIWVYMDRRFRRRKFLISTFLRCLGFSSDEDILTNFYTYTDIKTSLKSEAKLANLVFPDDIRHDITNALIAHRYESVTPAILKQLSLAGIKTVRVIDVSWDEGVLLSTMRADTTTNEEEALLDAYRKIRPGDPATASNAKSLIKRLFFDNRRYDIGKVGRYKLNQKLEEFRDESRNEAEVPTDLHVLDNSDIIKAVRMLLMIHSGKKQIDDIDHLGNRRIRTVGELLENQCRVGLARTERVIHERMSLTSADPSNESQQASPQRLVNSRTLSTVINDFFGRSQLSQFMDQTNPLSGLAHKRRLSALGPGGLSRDRAGFEVRDVHPSHYGRICPIETPEGPNIGLISSLGIYARINEYGFIETPYRKVIDGKVTDEVIYLAADEEEQYVIAQANAPLLPDNSFRNEVVTVRHDAEFKEAPRSRIDLMDVTPMQVISIASGLIPFLEHDDANRALMGANMMRQAVPLLNTERPYVATGLESRVAHDSRVVVVAEEDGMVASVDSREIVVSQDGKKPSKSTPKRNYTRYPLQKFRRTNAGTCFNQTPLVKEGQAVSKGDILADGPATDQGELALGKNLVVAFMPWCGYNFEDAIIVSQRVVRDDVFTSVHICEFECNARETKLGLEEITRDIPNVGEDALRNLDEHGVIRVGAEVKPGDILVGKITPKSETELLPEERLLRAIFGEKAADVRDSSLTVTPGTYGIVMDVKVTTDFRKSQSQSAVAALAGSLQAAPKRTVKDVDAEYDKEYKKLTDELTLSFCNFLLGEKVSIDIFDEETGDVIIAANRKITKSLLAKLAKRRENIQVENSPVRDKIMEITNEFTPKFDEILEKAEEERSNIEKGLVPEKGEIKSVKVYIAEKKNLSVGDKLAGRHGNKGVVARIVPDCDMPFLSNGQPVDIVLNPLGVPSRMNLGQVFETHLGAACRALGMYAGSPVFDGVFEEDIHKMLIEAGKKPDSQWISEDGKALLYDGRTGEHFDQRVMVGVIYMLKLHHLVTDKLHARSVGPYSLVTQQPLGGKAQAGGQRMGEMEVWALEAYGVAYALQELLTVKSDDVAGRTRIYESIVKGQNVLQAGVPETFSVLMRELNGLCLNMKLIQNERVTTKSRRRS
jgi:DNA-directed RNA polymerase subunit beta